MLLDVLEQARVPLEPLIEGLPATLDELRDPSRRIDWEVFARFTERLGASDAIGMPLDELGARMVDAARADDFLLRTSRFVVTPRQLYWIGQRFLAPAFFGNVTVRSSWLGPQRLQVTCELLPGYRPSETFFRIAHGHAAALPRLLGLPAATVEEEQVSGTRARLVVTIPTPPALLGRLLRRARTLVDWPGAVGDVVRQQAMMEESLAAIRASRQEFHELLERLSIGVLIHRDLVVSWANASMIASLGHTRLDDVAGKELTTFLPTEDRGPLRASVASSAPGQSAASPVEYRVKCPDGTIHFIEAIGTEHLEYDGSPARIVVCRDVTEQRRLREQLVLADRMASLGSLAAGVAHEINNPLAYVHTSLDVALGELEALGAEAGSEVRRAVEALERARSGAGRVREIVRDLKTLSRADDEPAAEAVDVNALLDATLALAARAIDRRARLVRERGPIPAARATRGRLGQVLLNLLLNAADAIPEGAADRHRVRVGTSTDAEGRAVIEVGDTGPGVPAEIARRIFDPFFTTKPVGAGTGLGLSICHRIVSELGGEISFTSEPGAGTTFRVVLPAAEASVEEAHPPERQAAAPATRGRILIVDDEPLLLRAMSDLLASAHDVVVAQSGRQALDLLRSDRAFDVVVADLMMADVNGMELYEAVRVDHPGLEERILFMTGGAFTLRARDFLAEVSNPRIEKPFAREDLLSALAACMTKGSPTPGG